MRKFYFLLVMCVMASMLSASVVKTVTATTAGSLHTFFAGIENTTVTDLTVTGPIDARDFKYMRDTLSVLATIDLSNTNILDYNGTNGTLSTVATDYPANTVPNSAFKMTAGKASLILVILPNSIVGLADNAFYKCSGLTTINIPSTVNAVGQLCFMYCSSLESVTLPPNLVTISLSTFYGCVKLTSMVIPSSVTTINNSAFNGCTGLTSIVLPSTVTTMGASLFSGCTGLKSAVMPNSLTSSGNGTFNGCSSLTSVTLPSAITLIDQSSFRNCTALTEFIIPSTVKTLGVSCFQGCTSLLSIEIPSSVVTTNLTMFMGCTSLAKVIFDENGSTSFMGNQSFQDCLNLKEVYINRAIVPYSAASFFQNVVVGNVKLYVPAASLTLYQANAFWKTFQSVSAITTTGVNVVKENSLKAYQDESGLVVNSTVANELIEVYSMVGVRVASARSQVGTTTIALPKRNIYIVRMGGRTSKVIL
jgi:hypothetical protein